MPRLQRRKAFSRGYFTAHGRGRRWVPEGFAQKLKKLVHPLLKVNRPAKDELPTCMKA